MLELIANSIIESTKGGNIGSIGFAVFLVLLVFILVEILRTNKRRR